MSVPAARHARHLLQQIEEMARSGADTSFIVESVSAELRMLVSREMTLSERSEYTRRIVAGESVLAILKDISRAAS